VYFIYFLDIYNKTILKMENLNIKELIREQLALIEAKTHKKKRKQIKAEYAEIRNGLKGVGAPSQADVMQLAGLGSVGDKTAESLFSKKLRRVANEEGGLYQFDDQERAAVIKAIATAKK
jgi:hydrogenase maturation factor HypE